MNNPESSKSFLPKQAMPPTPEHYSLLVGDGMAELAKVSLQQTAHIPSGSLILDNGCGSGDATTAVMATVPAEVAASIKFIGVDILEPAIIAYRSAAKSSSWPAEGQVADANALPFADDTFTHAIGNAFLFTVSQNDGIEAVKEMRRTLKPGGTLIVNSLAYVPNMIPLREASRATRPPGAPLPRQDMDKWGDPAHLAGVVEAGGFDKASFTVTQCEYTITTAEFHRYATLLWSFIGGTTSNGWNQEDEDRWDEAVEVVKQELKKTEGFKLLDDGRAVLRFVANVAIATK